MENKSITHVGRLNSLSKLKHEGFEGIDISLEESLRGFGIIWKDCGKETLFVYRIAENKYDRSVIKNDLDFNKEYSWIDLNIIIRFIGIPTIKEWNNLPITRKIYVLFEYYGYEEIFGSSYWEGFGITED